MGPLGGSLPTAFEGVQMNDEAKRSAAEVVVGWHNQ